MGVIDPDSPRLQRLHRSSGQVLPYLARCGIEGRKAESEADLRYDIHLASSGEVSAATDVVAAVEAYLGAWPSYFSPRVWSIGNRQCVEGKTLRCYGTS